jgi:hypothetical protein
MGTRSWDRGGLRGCSPAPQSEPEIDSLDIEDLADILTAGRGQIGVGHAFSFTARRDVPPTVTAVNFDALGRYTIEEVPRLMLLPGSGVLNRSTYNRMIEERDRRSGPWVSTMDPRAKLNIVGQGLTTTIHHRGRPLAALGPRT